MKEYFNGAENFVYNFKKNYLDNYHLGLKNSSIERLKGQNTGWID